MKLLSCHIENFGKISNFDYIFQDGLNLINQPNGWGKTTFACFLKAMFFGMEKKGKQKSYVAERSKYAPWQGGVYGGSVIFENEGKTYRILRTFGQTPEGDRFELVDVKTGAISKDYSSRIGEELFNTGSETFAMTTFFPQGELDGEINDEVRAFLTGANGLNADLESYEKAVASLDKKLKHLKAQCPSVLQIRETEEKQENLRADLNELEENKSIMLEAFKARENQLKMLKDAKKENLKSTTFKNEYESKQSLLQEKKDKRTQQETKFKISLLLSAFSILGVIGFVMLLSFFVKEAVLLTLFSIIAVLFALGLILCVIFAFKLKTNLKLLEKEQNLLQNEILKLNELVLNIQDEDPASFYEEKSRVEREYAVLDVKLKAIEKEISRVLESLDEKQLEERNLKSLKESIESKMRIVMNVKSFMLKAKQNVSQRFVEPMQKKLSQILQTLSQDNINARVDFDMDIKIDTPIGLKEVDFLSRGRQDLLAICKRFALIESVFVKTKPFIVLDDPFVNLDEKTLQGMMGLIKSFAKTYQIVYLTCHGARI